MVQMVSTIVFTGREIGGAILPYFSNGSGCRGISQQVSGEGLIINTPKSFPPRLHFYSLPFPCTSNCLGSFTIISHPPECRGIPGCQHSHGHPKLGSLFSRWSSFSNVMSGKNKYFREFNRNNIFWDFHLRSRISSRLHKPPLKDQGGYYIVA